MARWSWEAPIDGVPRVATLERAGLRGVTSVFQPDRALRLVRETHNVAAAAGTTIAPNASWNAGNAAVAGYAAAGKPWRTYTLDSRHNWKTVKSDTAPLGMTTAVNALDAYLSFAGEAPLYDAAGNVTQRGDDRFTYDAYGQLVELRIDGRMFGYRYDALGRVVQETDHSTGAATLYGYDGQRRTLRRDPTGLLHVMVDGDGLDEHLVQLTAGVPASIARKYYHQDRQGSVYLITDRNGAPQEWYRYTAYGELTIESPTGSPRLTSAIGNRFGYQGHLFNESIGLVHMRARFYDPTWGRFLTQDPLGLLAGPNRYAFVDSAPLSFIDPLGLTKRPSGDPLGLARQPGQMCSWLAGYCWTPQKGGWDNFVADLGRGLDALDAARRWADEKIMWLEYKLREPFYLLFDGLDYAETRMCGHPNCLMFAVPFLGHAVDGTANGLRWIFGTRAASNARRLDAVDDAVDAVRAGTAAPGVGPGALAQLTRNSCGPTCGAMLLGDRGIGAFRSQIAAGSGVLTSAESLARGMNAIDDAGTWIGAGVDASSFAGLNRTGSWAAMLWQRGAKTGHWVVVDGVEAGKVMLRDPAVGRVTMTVDEFMEKWNGFAVWRQ